ncbi:hypothetical protein HMJ29_04430 [Hymenobacter taeanensis]|uniref:Outer membrane beta-barrel protein n=1 Tax=Hymenobacter taeanensis TaxID=2735321 RepID=A0A6M6BGS1_9BACT|nr:MULTISPECIES: hypothetical protein [Hymenobacter]QJX46225.1 hypothetical protein HMJ29_04430 [Hymenobacter taeanensis]UOQ80080.1 hypothetical protein MUN83_14700 [Hymenobacter sp. 5414T-23]
MRKNLLTIAALGLVTVAAQAQQFEPGYLVRQAGDTLRGTIENEFWEDAPRELRFRSQPTAAIMNVSTRSLRGFGLSSGRQWRAQVLSYDAAAESRRTYVQRDAPRTRMVTDTLLTELLLDGPLSLTVAFRSTSPHYFVQRAGQAPLELVNRVYSRTNADGREILSQVNNFREQLRLYLQPECPAVAQRWNQLRFEAASLRTFLVAYKTECLGLPALKPEPGAQPAVTGAGKMRLEVGVLAGASFVNSHFSKPSYITTDVNYPGPGANLEDVNLEQAYLSGAQLERGVRPVAGAYLDALFPGRRFALHLEGQVRRRSQYTAAFSTNQATYPTKTYTVGARTLPSVALGFRLFRPVGLGQVVAGAGLALQYNSSLPSRVDFPDASQREFRGLRLPDARVLVNSNSQFAPYAELGYRRGRLTGTLNWRYFSDTVEDPSTINRVLYNRDNNTIAAVNTTLYSYRTQQFQLNVAYRLNRNTDK